MTIEASCARQVSNKYHNLFPTQCHLFAFENVQEEKVVALTLSRSCWIDGVKQEHFVFVKIAG